MLTLGSRDFQAQPLNQEQEMNLNFECTKGNWNCFKLKAYKMQAKIKNVEVKLELKHCICLQNQKCYTRSKKILILKWWKWDHLAQSQPESQPLHPLRCILDQPWSTSFIHLQSVTILSRKSTLLPSFISYLTHIRVSGLRSCAPHCDSHVSASKEIESMNGSKLLPSFI